MSIFYEIEFAKYILPYLLILNRVVNSLNAVYIGLAYFHLGLWGNPHPFGHAETVKRLS